MNKLVDVTQKLPLSATEVGLNRSTRIEKPGHRCQFWLAVIAYMIWLCGLAQAQAVNENGFKPYGSYQGSDIDSVNLNNGHLELRLPMVTYPQRGGKLQLSFRLGYASANWAETMDCSKGPIFGCIFQWQGRSGLLQLGSDSLLFMRATLGQTGSLTLPDGSAHPLGWVTNTNTYETLDGSGFKADRDGTSTSPVVVYYPDGTHIFPAMITSPSTMSPAMMEDADGNQIVEDWPSWTIIDTLGRHIPDPFRLTSATPPDPTGCTGPLPITSTAVWQVPGANGSTITFKLCFATTALFMQHFATDDQHHLEPHGTSAFTGVLQSVVLPDNTAWTFEYTQPDANGVTWADLAKITFPAGGSISYTWDHPYGCVAAYQFQFGTNKQTSSRILTRTVDPNDGSAPKTWRYVQSTSTSARTLSTTVTDPLLNDTVHTFTDFNNSCSLYETQTALYNGSSTSGSLLKTITTDYSWTPNPLVQSSPANPNPPPPPAMNVVPIRTTTTWPNGTVTKIEHDYDSGFTFNVPMMFSDPPGQLGPPATGIYGKITAERVFDYGNGAPGPLLRRTSTTYAWQSNPNYLTYNILNTPATVAAYDAAGNIVAQTVKSYDETALASSGITAGHSLEPINGNVRGNATTVKRWLSGSTVSTSNCLTAVSNGYLSATNTYFDTGLVQQSSDPCQHQTTYQYSAAAPFWGGFLTQRCNGLNQCATMDYDFNTGSLASSTDPNSKKTTYGYDNVGRLTSVAYPDGGQITANYPNPTTVEKKQLQDATANTWIDQFMYFDGLGRPKQTRLVDPEGDVYSEKTYDALGRVSTTTNPHRTVAAPTDGVTTTQYDAIGRIISVTHPDLNLVQTSYSDPNIVTLTDETGRQRREINDALGRMIQVDEPGDGGTGTNSAGALTVNGTLQSAVSGGSPATHATGSVTISGAEQSIDTGGGDPGGCPPPPMPCTVSYRKTSKPMYAAGVDLIYDAGTVTITVNGHSDTYFYGQNDTPNTIAAGLASIINGDSGAAVTATASGATLTLTSKGTGSAVNYSLSSSYLWDTIDFGGPSFTTRSSGSALIGGQNAVGGTTVYDSGTVTISAGGASATANYGNGTGQDGTASAVASDLAGKLTVLNPPFTVSALGATLTLNWKTAGASGNVAVTLNSVSTQSTIFPTPSFSSPGTTLSGGTDPYPSGIGHPFSTFYRYDVLNNLLRVEQHGNTTDSTQWRVRTFSYDSFSRLLRSNNPEAGQINYQYDADGNPITRTDAKGVVTTNSYDALNRLTLKTYSDGTPSEYFAYDAGGGWGIPQTNTIGRLTEAWKGSVCCAAVATIFGYDAMGRVVVNNQCLPSNCGTANFAISAAYDLAGELTSLAYPSGRTVSTGYSPAGRPTNLQFVSFGSQTVNYPYYTVPQASTATAWGYNPDGSLHLGAFGNGVSETYGYNNRGQLNAITASSSSQTWFSKLYGLYDAGNHDNGNIGSIVDGLNSGRSQFYTYDALSRVTSGYQQDGAFNQTFTYDPWANMKTSGTNNFSPVYDGNNRIIGPPSGCTSATAYCYDPAGNMLNDSFHQYAYDAANRVKTVDSTGATYTYGAGGERVRKDTTGNSTEYIYFAGAPIAERDVTSGNWSDYIFFNGRRIAKADNFENVIHLHGTRSGTAYQDAVFGLDNLLSQAGLANYTVKSGDRVFLRQRNSPDGGGIGIYFTDGNCTGCNGYALTDSNGLQLWSTQTPGTWYWRQVDLTPIAGKQISTIRVVATTLLPAGNWDLYFADISIVGADGTVHPLFSGAPSVSLVQSATGMTNVGYEVLHNLNLAAPQQTTSYYHSDQIGSSRIMTAGGGWPVWQGTFTPFGQEVSPEITTNHYKFNGKERGEASEGGLDYFGARYYSSIMGRWMTPDWSDVPSPIPYATLANPQSLNLYSYVTDDPLSHTDLDGHLQAKGGSGGCVNAGYDDTCTTTTTIETEDDHAWITTRTEHHWTDDDGNAHTGITYTYATIVVSDSGDYQITSVWQNTHTYAGTSWQDGVEESHHVRSWEGKEANSGLGMSVASKMIGSMTLDKAAAMVRPSTLERLPGELAKDYQEHPHYYHSVVAAGAAIPVAAGGAVITGAVLGVAALVEAVRDKVDDKRPF